MNYAGSFGENSKTMTSATSDGPAKTIVELNISSSKKHNHRFLF